MKKIHSILLLFCFIATGVQAQNSGDSLFNNEVLHEVKLTFESDDWYSIMEGNFNFGGDTSVYLMANVEIDGTVIDSIGVRFKGFTSFVPDAKKPFKIDFNEFVSGKKYDGLRKINLNNGFADPAIQRDFICYDILRRNEVAAPRNSYTKLYVNNEYFGCYMLTEQIDKSFLKDNFKDSNGSLYKNTGWTNHEYLGDEESSYSPPFELRTNREDGNYQPLIDFASLLSLSTDEEFREMAPKILDIDKFLRTLSVDVITNNWDSYLEHGRNWYVYQDIQSNKLHWIPWDYNLALGGSFGFGGGPGGGGGGTDPGYCGGESWDECTTITDGSSPYPADDTIFQQVVTIDCFCCNNDWDEQCQDQYDDILNGTNPGGGDPGGGGDPFAFNFDIDQRTTGRLIIKRLLNEPIYYKRYTDLICSTLDHNFTADRIFEIMDKNYAVMNEAVNEDPNFLYSMAVYDNDMNGDNGLRGYIESRIDNLNTSLTTSGTCTAVSSMAFQDITINELVASNDSTSTITDEFGENDDWIELYNNTDQDIDLTGGFLSDNSENVDKWEFPVGSIVPAGGYYIIWADEDGSQGPQHANFKLSKSGESIYLRNEALEIIDSISYGEQVTNMGYARVPNGTGDFVIQPTTFSANNESNSITEIEQQLDIEVYPIPASERISIETPSIGNTIYKAELVNNIGQVLGTYLLDNGNMSIDVSNYDSGIYYLNITNQDNAGSTEKIIIQR